MCGTAADVVCFSAGDLHWTKPSQGVCTSVGDVDHDCLCLVSSHHWVTTGDSRLPQRSQTTAYVQLISSSGSGGGGSCSSSSSFADAVRRSAASPLLSVPRLTTDFTRRSFSYAAPVIWNSLPTEVMLCDSEHSFERNLKTFLFNCCHQTVWPIPHQHLCSLL